MSAYSSYSDEHLVTLLQDSDVKAFTALYDRYWKRLFTLAAGKINDLHIAEDIVQDVFADLWKRRADINIKGLAAAYLSSATKYKVMDTRLKLARKSSREHLYHNSLQDNHSEIDQLTDFHLLQKHLKQLLEDLPPKSREIYLLSKQNGVNHREIATRLHLSEKTVEYHLTKVIKSLRTSLGHFFNLVLAGCLFIF